MVQTASIHSGSRGTAEAASHLMPSERVSMKEKLKGAVYSFNLFKEGLFIDDAETLLHGWRKSIIFVVVYAISAAAAIAYTSLMPVTVQQTLFNPTLEQYLAIEQYAPSCACSSNPVVGDAASINLPPGANLSLNLCGVVDTIATETSSVLSTTHLPPNFQAISIFLALINFAADRCNILRDAQSTYTITTLETALGTFLLTQSALAYQVKEIVIRDQLQLTSVTQTLYAAIAAQIGTGAPPAFDVSYNATSRTPANCSCDPAVLVNSPHDPYTAILRTGTCNYHAAFDWRTNSSVPPLDPNLMWTCNFVLNVVSMPVELFDTPLYELLHLAPPYDRFQYSRLNSSAIMVDVWMSPSVAVFGTTIDGSTNFNVLQPGIVTSDYNAYFAKCAPASCTFTRSGRPPPITAINTSLGIVSGLQTVLMLLVGYGYMMIIRRKTAAPNTMVTLEPVAGGGEGDEEGERELRVRPSRRQGGQQARPLPSGPRPPPGLRGGSVSGASTPGSASAPTRSVSRVGAGSGGGSGGGGAPSGPTTSPRVTANPLSLPGGGGGGSDGGGVVSGIELHPLSPGRR